MFPTHTSHLGLGYSNIGSFSLKIGGGGPRIHSIYSFNAYKRLNKCIYVYMCCVYVPRGWYCFKGQTFSVYGLKLVSKSKVKSHTYIAHHLSNAHRPMDVFTGKTKESILMSYAVKSGSMQSRQNTLDAIRRRVPFATSGALIGVAGNPGVVGMLSANSIDYIVFSYKTPIAWHCADTIWYIVDQKFSVTTTNHQSVVRRTVA